jgi:hypothetical protein
MNSDERPEAEKNLGLFLNPSGSGPGGGFLVPMTPLTVGPGDPGPADEWEFPVEPADETAGENVSTPGPARSTEEEASPPNR